MTGALNAWRGERANQKDAHGRINSGHDARYRLERD
jgi:hypothetical protein